MYYRTDTNEILATHSDIRRSFSSGDIVVLFLDVITDEDLAERGVFPLVYQKPTVGPTQIAKPTQPELVDGVWVQAWSVEEATPEEIAENNPVVVPDSVAMWQARTILIEDDMLDDVNTLLATIPDEKARKLAQAKFEYSSTVRRDDPIVTMVIPQLGKTEDEINQMFIRAAALS
jgi:hypothetical protein